MAISNVSIIILSLFLCLGFKSVESFVAHPRRITQHSSNTLSMAQDKDSDKPKNFLDDLMGMFSNFDDVVDDFVMKRMGNGEQFYGKRKYNPSGNYDGNYNGMGQSSHYAIEIARVQKEVMEERRQRRLEEEEAARSK